MHRKKSEAIYLFHVLLLIHQYAERTIPYRVVAAVTGNSLHTS